jgi:hypothetical protein
MTLRSVERGGSGVTIGAYVAVMQVLGIEEDLQLMAHADPVGRSLQDARLSPHSNTTARKQSTSGLGLTARMRGDGEAVSRRHRLAQNSAEPQLPRPFESLPAEQMNKVLEALPETQIRQALSALPSEQMRMALDALSGTQVRNVLGALPPEQLRAAFDAQASAIEKLRKPTEDAREWLERSGFASSQALASLIEAAAPLSKAKRR